MHAAGLAKSCDLAERLDRRALLQKLQAGDDNFVTRLQAADHRIGVTDCLSDVDWYLVSDVTVTLRGCKVDEGLAADETDGENGNDRSGCGAPGHSRIDE